MPLWRCACTGHKSSSPTSSESYLEINLPTDADRYFSKHLDSHLKPYRCNFGECVDTQFSSTGCLLRHEREVHKLHDYGPKAYLVDDWSRNEPSKETATPCYLKRSAHQDVATHRTQDPPRNPHVCPFQDCDHILRKASGDEGDARENVEGAHVLGLPATVYDMTTSLNDNVGRRGVDITDTHHTRKHNITSRPRYHPKLATIPLRINPKRPKETIKERNEKFMVDIDFLHKLETKISDLQSRVEECESAPGSSTNSSVFDNGDSVDSFSDFGHKGGRAAKYSQYFDDEIISHGMEVKKRKRCAKAIGPSLEIARLNHFVENQRFEAVREGMSTPPVLEFPADRPLLTAVSEYRNNHFWRRRLEIASPAFFDLLKEVSGHKISDFALHEGVFDLVEPLVVLFFNRKQLTDHVEDTDVSTQAKEHAKFILDFLKSDFSDISRVLDNFESATPPNLVKYCDLWMLYRPGTTVYSRANGEWEAFVVDCLDGMQVRLPSQDNYHALTRLDIRAWSLDFDGEVYGRVWSTHCVAPFHGVRNVSSLTLVPEKFLLDGNAIRESLLSRGKKFRNFPVHHCQEIEITPSQSTRVMVDHLTYQRRNGWLISIDRKFGPSSAKDRSLEDNKYSIWDKSAKAFDRRHRRYTFQRSLVRPFEDEYGRRDYELESIYNHEDTQAEPYRRYSTDRPSHIVVSEFEKYNLIRLDAEMNDFALMLCPQHVRGFCFRDKVWSKCIHLPVSCKF